MSGTAPTRTQKGRFSKIHFDSAGGESPTWVEGELVRDGSWSISPQMENVTVRKHGRANRQESYGYDLEVTFDLRVPVIKTGVPYYIQLRDGAKDGTPVRVRVSDGTPTVAGVQTLILWTEVSAFEESAPIDGHTVISITLVATSSDDEPTFATVSGS